MRKKFEKVTFFYLLREENQLADSLATLASMIQIPVGVKMMPLVIEQRCEPSFCMVTTIKDEEGEIPWYKNIWDFIERGDYPEDSSEKDKRAIRRFAA